MKLELIAAVGRNLELGKDNDLIFDIPGELKFFARTTRGHTWAAAPSTPSRTNSRAATMW